jgi:hypothetical protein
MLSLQRLLVVAVAAGVVSVTAPKSFAGQLWDSFFGRRPPAYPVGAPVPLSAQTQTAYLPATGYVAPSYVPPSYAPNAGSQLSYSPYAAPTPAYLRPQTLGYGSYMSPTPPTANAPLLTPGLPQTVAGYLPTAAYDTQWARTPVTYYRPVTAFDPRYGTTVTSQQPCTSYQYQAQRVPVIAPRPLLGDYGFQADKWHGITGPGYNPTGLAPSNIIPPFQSIPNTGMLHYGQPNAFVPTGSSGTSLGMPATSLPATTLNYGATPSAVSPYASTANYYGSTSQMPAANRCANGLCYPPASQMPIPNIPGATSVTPVGPPTYSATPNYGAVNPLLPNSYNPAINSLPGNMPAGNAFGPNPSGAPILPNGQVMPPNTSGSGSSDLRDPESTRPPSLNGSNASNTPAGNGIDVRRLPIVAIDRNVESKIQANEADRTSNPTASQRPAAAPDTLSPSGSSGVQPLAVPEDFDSKPRFNPSLLSPTDLTAMNNASQYSKPSGASTRRIQLVEVGSSSMATVALEPKSSDANSVQLISGSQIKGAIVKESPSNFIVQPGFRPVSELK